MNKRDINYGIYAVPIKKSKIEVNRLSGIIMSQEVEHFTKEKRVLIAMRKTLSSIIKDVTPSSSAIKSPLSEATVEDIKMCFGLISAREQEIAKEAGLDLNDRPHFTDEAVTSNVVSLDSLKMTISSVKDANPEGKE